jgi:LmbE family N-acetylglucosaminyl deacetylase
MGGMATVVAFHAHPDDEALYSGGTLARLAAEGNRVVIVVASDGCMGEADGRRLGALRQSAAILGAARVEHLGYADSGHGPLLYPDPPGRQRFARADPGEAAERLAQILREEHADVLFSYDAAGGYGHRDHVRVHEVGARAAGLAGDIAVLEATAPRELVTWPFWPVCLLRLLTRYRVAGAFTPRRAITHLIDIRRYAAVKRAAIAAHQSQVRSPLVRVLARMPLPLFRVLLGREWFAGPPGVLPLTAPSSRRLERRPS